MEINTERPIRIITMRDRRIENLENQRRRDQGAKLALYYKKCADQETPPAQQPMK